MSVISQMKEVVMASILSGKPPAQAEKNLFYLIDKSTGISNEKDKFLLREMYYIGLQTGDFELHNEIFFTLDLQESKKYFFEA